MCLITIKQCILILKTFLQWHSVSVYCYCGKKSHFTSYFIKCPPCCLHSSQSSCQMYFFILRKDITTATQLLQALGSSICQIQLPWQHVSRWSSSTEELPASWLSIFTMEFQNDLVCENPKSKLPVNVWQWGANTCKHSMHMFMERMYAHA